MKELNRDLRAPWVGCLLFAAAFAVNCGEAPLASEPVEVEQTSDALTQPQYECERAKRECLIAADCDDAKREACETTFRACEEPIKAERDKVRDACRATRESCDEAATDAAGRHACHIAEHKCKLPVDPPEAVCHIEAAECVWAARGGAEPTMPPEKSDAEKACRETERECRDAKRLDPKDLPKAPKCAPEPPPPPAECTPADPADPAQPGPADPADPETPAPIPDPACERTKRECLVAANCDDAKREACETAFRACEEPIKAERKKVRDACRETRKACDEAAADEAARHACHIAEHKCTLPVDPPEAVCRIEADECRWAARGSEEPAAKPDPAPKPDPAAKPDPMAPKPDPAAKPEPKPENEAEAACREKEHECKEAKRVPPPEDLPEPPKCPHKPPACKPAPKA